MKRQRISNPLLRLNLFFVKVDWLKVINLIKNIFINLNISNTRTVPLNFYTGDYLDIETAGILKKLSNVLGVVNSKNFSDQRFTLPIKDLENSKCCFLIDLNLRLQLPVLNLNLRQLWLKKGTIFYTIGHTSNFNFYIKHLSTNIKIFVEIIEGFIEFAQNSII